MTKHLDKQKLRLKARVEDFNSVPSHRRQGFYAPGSMNSRKTRSIKGRRKK
jgi:hypothetical protein